MRVWVQSLARVEGLTVIAIKTEEVCCGGWCTCIATKTEVGKESVCTDRHQIRIQSKDCY